MSYSSLLATVPANAIPITPVTSAKLDAWFDAQPEKEQGRLRQWAQTLDFKGKANSHLLVPGKDGTPERVLAGIDEKIPAVWALGSLPAKLPAGTYTLEGKLPASKATDYALGWLLGTYRFDRYLDESKPMPQLCVPEGVDADAVHHTAESLCFARDLINAPAADMLPSDLADAARGLAKRFGASCDITVGEELLKENFPSIYTVGKASADAPRLIDIRWGDEKHPKLTIVGKGVCFDTGGLDIKPSSAMALMRKDMAGAANVLALAMLIIGNKLPVRLRVLVPAVENAISGKAFRTGDIIKTRSGKTVEVGNTDAEGRLILCDCLWEAQTEKPDLLIDFATLTGAARVATGTDIAALFSNDDALAQELVRIGREEGDPCWQLPLVAEYRPQIDSRVADMNSVSTSPHAGAIIAALFLQEFIGKTKHWLHIDMMAWNGKPRPGRPEGGEAQAVRAVYALLEKRYAK